MPHFSPNMNFDANIDTTGTVRFLPLFSSPELSALARALSSRVSGIAKKGGDPTHVVYLACPTKFGPVDTRKSRADESKRVDTPKYPTGSVFRWLEGDSAVEHAVVTLGTFESPGGMRTVEYVEVSAGAHGKILRLSEAEFAVAYLR